MKRGWRKPNPIEPAPVEFGEYRPPNAFDVQWHYRSADYWLRVAGQPGRGMEATAAAASLAQAHATQGLLAHSILNQVVFRKGEDPTRRARGDR
jgi:hypothetical protein